MDRIRDMSWPVNCLTMLQYTLQTAGENQRVLFQSNTARNPEVETAVDFFGCSELIIFPIELHDSNSTLFGG